MLSFGRLMVTLQPFGPFCDVVPPGHSAESNTPPELLFTENVKSWPGHLQCPPVQKFVWQSPFPPHVLLSAQSAAQLPPQSTSLSEPFFTPSEQVALWQRFPMQTWLWQSLATLQAFPAAQPAHEPPQSMPVSAPFFTP